MKKLLPIATALLLSSTTLMAEDQIQPPDELAYVFESDSGKDLTIKYFQLDSNDVYFPTLEVNRKVKAALVCGEESELLKEFVLWMPHHGHGSAPTSISYDAETECSFIENINFVMPGHWELKLGFKDADSAVIEVDI